MVTTHWLSGDVVEVDEVADGVDGGEEEGGARADLVELEARVQRDVLRITIMVIVVVVVVWWCCGTGFQWDILCSFGCMVNSKPDGRNAL